MNDSDLLLQLLHAALGGPPPVAATFASAPWRRLHALSVRQGVRALAFDGALRLPADLQPERALRLQWGLGCEAIASRWEEQREAASLLARALRTEGVGMVVLKGLALAEYYPRPEHRECGDVDIYLCGAYEAGNRVAARLGARPYADHSGEKHDAFVLRGVMVENHRTLLDPSARPVDRLLEPLLQARAAASRPARQGAWLAPGPDFNALFLMRHAAKHFGGGGGIVLRHLCDWGLFLRAERERIDLEKVMEAVAGSGHERFWNIFTLLAGRVTGDDFSSLLTARPDGALLERVWQDILSDRSRPRSLSGPIAVLRFKLARLSSHRWKYGGRVLPDRFRDVALNSLRERLTHPRTLTH